MNNYKASGYNFSDIYKWLSENNIDFSYSYGTVYFKREEDLLAFKLKFGNGD